LNLREIPFLWERTKKSRALRIIHLFFAKKLEEKKKHECLDNCLKDEEAVVSLGISQKHYAKIRKYENASIEYRTHRDLSDDIEYLITNYSKRYFHKAYYHFSTNELLISV
jgi:hypothetical protein